MKFNKLAIIFLILVLTLLSGCNQLKNLKNNNSQPNTKSSTQNEKAIAENTTGIDQNMEAEYFPTDNPKYKRIGNARFNFWIDIPRDWKAFDRSVTRDGYIIVSDNEDIDIRAYGGLNAISSEDYINALKGDNGKVSDFVFRNNIIGKRVEKPNSEINFTCLLPDRHIDFFANFEKNQAWFDKNKDTLLYIAKSLRSGDEKKSKTEVITDINNWNHPVKKTFQDNGVDIIKVELSNGSTYPTFYIKLPYKVNLENEDMITNLFNEVALSNGVVRQTFLQWIRQCHLQ